MKKIISKIIFWSITVLFTLIFLITGSEKVQATSFCFSLSNIGPYTVGNLEDVDNEDIILFDGTNFQMIFDGSDVGLTGENIDAIHVLDSMRILMSFTSSVNFLDWVVEDEDIVLFEGTLGENTEGTFNLFFDGSESGLMSAEEYNPGATDTDAITLLPDGRLLLSTTGAVEAEGLGYFDNYGIRQDEDVLAFTPNIDGDYLSGGTWSVYIDGSDIGLSYEDLKGLDVSSNSGDIFMTMDSSFDIGDGLTVQDEDIVAFIPDQIGKVTMGEFLPDLVFDGSQYGIGLNDIDAISTVSIPEPANLLLLIVGLIGIAGLAKKFKA